MNIPTVESALRIAALLHRRPDTPWNDKEVRAYKKLVKAGCFKVFDGLEMIERRYKALWPPDRDKNSLRHGLLAWLNGYGDELDRATLWCEQHPLKSKPKKIISFPPAISEPLILSLEDQAQSDRFLEQLRERKRTRGNG